MRNGDDVAVAVEMLLLLLVVIMGLLLVLLLLLIVMMLLLSPLHLLHLGSLVLKPDLNDAYAQARLVGKALAHLAARLLALLERLAELVALHGVEDGTRSLGRPTAARLGHARRFGCRWLCARRRWRWWLLRRIDRRPVGLVAALTIELCQDGVAQRGRIFSLFFTFAI